MLIYLITNKSNGKRYVGLTTGSLQSRWYLHVANAYKQECPLAKAIVKHGPESFELSVLEECFSHEELREAEKKWIAELGTFQKEYNATRGGDGLLGYKHTEDAKRRMSEARKGEKNPNYGKDWGFKWKDHPERLRARGEAMSGENAPMYGKHHTDEARAKISQAQYKEVAQCDAAGHVIAIFSSVKHAAEALASDASKVVSISRGISRACRFSTRTAAGFRWKYTTDAVKK